MSNVRVVRFNVHKTLLSNLKTFEMVACFFLVGFVQALIRPLTSTTAAATPLILFTEMLVYVPRRFRSSYVLEPAQKAQEKKSCNLFKSL